MAAEEEATWTTGIFRKDFFSVASGYETTKISPNRHIFLEIHASHEFIA
jgi:hypothetical protein